MCGVCVYVCVVCVWCVCVDCVCMCVCGLCVWTVCVDCVCVCVCVCVQSMPYNCMLLLLLLPNPLFPVNMRTKDFLYDKSAVGFTNWNFEVCNLDPHSIIVTSFLASL